MNRIEGALFEADLFVSIGTSAVVYPAAAFVHLANGHTLELNLEASVASRSFSESRLGPATELVPAWVEELLRG
jgi:NAD-dependent deacetylase